MRTLCDSCESGAAMVFCAADEAALCRDCDQKVHLCNKLASRHVRVGLASPSDVPRCDICENAPAFFFCDIDGSSLCLQCDISVHVGGKRTHGRYLLLRQRVEFPGDRSGRLEENDPPNEQNLTREMFDDGENMMDGEMFDLNMRPQRLHGQPSSNPPQGMEVGGTTNPDVVAPAGVDPVDPRI